MLSGYSIYNRRKLFNIVNNSGKYLYTALSEKELHEFLS